MDRRSTPDLFDAILDLYGRIGTLLNWRAINDLRELHEVQTMLDSREQMIREIGDHLGELENRLTPEGLKSHPRYHSLAQARDTAVGMDDSIKQKIQSKMTEIQNELKAKTLFRTHALPSYMKQKMAFSR